ncbi:MAG: ABC transporter permease, partial [Gemmatimonadota bacterium]
IGIGGATAVFSLVDGVLLRPLPYADASRLVTLDVRSTTGHLISLSIPNYRDWRDRNRSFVSFGASAGWGFVRETREGAERVDARAVLGDFFATLGLQAGIGRVFNGDETTPGSQAVAVLGHGFWERAYGADPDIVGKALVLDGRPFTVIGVLPRGAGYPRADVEAYVPMGVLAAGLPWDDRQSSFGTRALARLAPGVTQEAAQRDMNRVAAEVDALEGRPQAKPEVRSLQDLLVGDVRRGLWLLMGAVSLLLLIGGANVANLALARSEERGAELAVRRALGAGTAEVTRLLVSESLLLSLMGGVLGFILAAALLDVATRLLPLHIPPVVAGRIGMTGSVTAFALSLAVASGVLFALVPALGAARGHRPPGHGLRTTGSREAGRARDALVVAQVTLSVTLLVGAGLLMRSLHNLASVDPGFDDTGVFTARLSSPRGAFASTGAWMGFYDDLLATLDASPDVSVSAASLLIPLTGRSWERRAIPDNVPYDPDEAPSVLYDIVSEDYFEAMGIPILEGRSFTRADAGDAPLVVVIDETMAERFWPGEDPIGRRLSMEELTDSAEEGIPWRTVVGVVPNVRHYELDSPSRIQAWIPFRQALGAAGVDLSVVARTRGDATGVPRLVRSTVARLRPDIPVVEPRMLSGYVADELGPNRALGDATVLFGIVATLMAALGIFGVLSLAVARRTAEIGVRLAVGATPRDVVVMVMRRALSLALVGTVLGLIASAVAGDALAAVLYEVHPRDAAVYSAVCGLLLAVASLAALTPALRAAATRPARVLREE